MLVVASNEDVLPAPDWEVFNFPEIARDLCHSVVPDRQALEATRLFDRATLAPLLAAEGRLVWPNSDFHPRLDLGAEKARYFASVAAGFRSLGSERFDLVAALNGVRRGPFEEADASLPLVPRVHALALGARLRGQTAAPADGDAGETERVVRASLSKRDKWQTSAGTGPTDWHAWLEGLKEVEADLSGGTAGVADEALYAEVERYLDRHAATETVRDVVAFRHGLASWDFAQVDRAGTALAATFPTDRPWIAPDELREGLVVARLKLGDGEGARRAFDELGRFSQRPSSDLRSRLLGAIVVDRGGSGGR
jgi:hypothetical protein